MALVKEYFEITKKYKLEYGHKTILLMQVGAFFEVYGLLENKEESQIYEFAQICDLNIGDKKTVGSEQVVMAGFSLYMIDKYIKKLQDAGYTIIIYEQDETKTTRHLTEIYSPGTYFSLETSNNTKLTNNITCIWINISTNHKNKNKIVHVGLANIDIYTGKSSIFEFSEIYVNNPTTFDELERFISIYLPSEVILIYNISVEKEINDIICYSNLDQCKSIHKINILDTGSTPMNIRASNCEKQTYQTSILEKFFKIADYDIFYENTIATQAFCFLLDFIFQHNPDLVNNIHEPIFENCSDRLILANHSLKQLNIIDTGEDKGPYSSVEKLLNICLTPMGKRQFSYNLLNPCTDVKYLQKEYDIIEHILDHYANYDYLRHLLYSIKDISKFVRQIMLKKIAPKQLFQLYKNLKTILEIREKTSPEYILETYLKRSITCSNIEHINKYCGLIIHYLETNFVLEECEQLDTITSFDCMFLKPGVNEELDDKIKLLDESREKIEAIRQYLNECIAKMEKSKTTMDSVKIHETEKNNFSLIATKRRCQILKQYLSTNGGNTVSLEYTIYGQPRQFQFTISNILFETQTTSNDSINSPQIKELCKNISTIKITMKELITTVYLTLIKNMNQFSKEFDSINQYICAIDNVYAKATIARKYNYCKPTISSFSLYSYVKVKSLRHCLIEHIQQNELYVSNDILLGYQEEKEPEKRENACAGGSGLRQGNGTLLYGTNAVGKTSFIRSIGIAVIMAQAGLYVPAASFEFYPYKYIFTRILGNDNIFKNLSTFAVEMSELRTILRLADKNSLVLGDELCSGTESISAVSIFVAGVKTLNEIGCSFIFATHLHEIIDYEEIQCCHLKHMSVIFDREKDSLVYDRKLKDGPGNNMYGLEVCRSLNLPETFLELAHNIRVKYNPQYASILDRKQSYYNANKIIGQCEMCNDKIGTEIHHLQHQKEANESNIIISKDTTFHKNHNANLITLCEKCHLEFHKLKNTMHKKVKTSKGQNIVKI
jgi:DNA mismatch repair protein MutS